MDVLAFWIVFRRVIAKEAQVDKVGGGRQELEGREIAFVKRTGVGPNPANAIFLEQPDMLRSMPAGVAKLDGKSEVARQLREEDAEQRAPFLWRKGRRQLDQDDMKLRREQFDCLKECGELRVAVAEK